MDPMEYRLLRSLHEEAVSRELEVFTFQGNDMHVAYAGYLLEYLANEFPELVTGESRQRRSADYDD